MPFSIRIHKQEDKIIAAKLESKSNPNLKNRWFLGIAMVKITVLPHMKTCNKNYKNKTTIYVFLIQILVRRFFSFICRFRFRAHYIAFKFLIPSPIPFSLLHVISCICCWKLAFTHGVSDIFFYWFLLKLE